MQKFLRILQILLPFEQLAQPGESLYIADLKIFAFLVAPVRGDPFFGYPVHFMSSDLDFDALAVGTDNAGVQRLVHVRFRQRDIVFETPRAPGATASG